jgi:parvulin-like peptidyl-prolyl isomerase
MEFVVIRKCFSLPFNKAALLALAVLVAAAANAADAPLAKVSSPPPIFATVGGTVITQDQYDGAFRQAARRKFYHGKPPEGAIAALQREVGDELVAQVLLVREAKRRGVQADAQEVRKQLQAFEQRFAANETWKKNRSEMLPAVTEEIEQVQLVKQLEQQVREAVVPTTEQVAAYYGAHSDKFTEPERLHVQLILLKVEPWSPKETWEAVAHEAQDLVKRLREGADFAELARQVSGDESAQKGGDMGYVHSGMLPDGAQKALDEMKPNELSAPLQTLQGYAVFRLLERKPARVVAFETVRQRAQEMLQGEQRDQAWKSLIAGLKKDTPAQVDESRYLPLSEPTAARPSP